MVNGESGRPGLNAVLHVRADLKKEPGSVTPPNLLTRASLAVVQTLSHRNAVVGKQNIIIINNDISL